MKLIVTLIVLSLCVYLCVGPRYIELFLHSTEDSGGPQAVGGVAGGIKYGQQPQTQQGWGDNRAQVREKGERESCMHYYIVGIILKTV